MSTISENDIHAYVDGQLDEAQRLRVEAHLAQDALAAERVRAWRDQNEALRVLYNPVLNEAVPQRLLVPRAAPSRWPKYAMAAGALGLSFGMGWLLHADQAGRSAEMTALPRRAAMAYAVYAPEVRHPVEVGAEQQDHLVKWLSKRLGHELRVPLLVAQGYELMGGRLLPGGQGPVAQFMYQDAKGQRLTLYVSRHEKETQNTAFRFSQEDKVAVFYWIDGNLGYALSAEMDRARLLLVASAVYKQLNP